MALVYYWQAFFLKTFSFFFVRNAGKRHKGCKKPSIKKTEKKRNHKKWPALKRNGDGTNVTVVVEEPNGMMLFNIVVKPSRGERLTDLRERREKS